MKKFNFKTTILSLLLGAVIALCALPTNLGKLFASADAPKNPYPTPGTVDVSGSFDNNQSSTPDKWTLSAEYNNNDENDSTSFNGVISADLKTWSSEFDKWLNDYVETWDKNHEFTFGSADRALIEQAIKSDITKTNSPLVPNFNLQETTNHKILALMSGKTYTKYLNDTEDAVELNSSDRSGYVKYTSNEFKLDQYSFYKISVWVKVTDGGVASISLNGGIDEQVFGEISNTGTVNNVTYHFYTLNDGLNTSTFVSTTAPDAPSIEHNGLTYNLTLDHSKFEPDTTDPDYTQDYANYFISTTGKTEVASFTDWTQYSIYVSTTTETNVSISLALGNQDTKSTGNVYFDDVKVEQIQLLDFYKNAITSSTKAVIDNREILDPQNPSSRNYNVIQDFENSTEWSIVNSPLDSTDLLLVEEEAATGFVETFPQNNVAATNKVLKVNNHGTKEVKIKSNTFTVERMRYYRVSIWAQSIQSDATMTMQLISTKSSGAQATSKDTTSPYISGRDGADLSQINNFWVNYIFYIKAPAEKSTEAYFNITLSAGAIVYFDNMVIETVTKKEYTDSKNNKLDLSTEFKNQIVANSNFFDYDNVDVENYGKPLPPSNWSNVKTADVYEYYNDAAKDKFTQAYFKEDLTFSSDEKTITFDGKDFVKAEDSNTYNYKDGDKIKEKIVLVKEQQFLYNAGESAFCNDRYELEIATTAVAGVIAGSTSSNILSITTSAPESITYKSAAINMSATGSLYILTIDVYTDITAVVNLRLVDEKKNVYATLAGVNTYDEQTHTSAWKTYKFYVNTGLETAKLYLELEFSENVGNAQFKNLNAFYTSSVDAVLPNLLSKTHKQLVDDGVSVVNLANETFIEHSANINSNTHLFDTNLYKEVEIDGATSGLYGILDTSNPHTNYTSINAKDKDVSPYVLVIKNAAGESTKLKALRSFTLKKAKCMKITIVAKVDGLSDGKYADITFADLEKSFAITNTEFTEYVLYVDNTDGDKSATINYAISLLDAAGTLVIDSISVESLDNLTSVTSEYPDGDTETVKFATITTDKAEEKTEEEPEDVMELEDENNTLEIFLAVLSSLLLVAAIVFAIVYTRIKTLRRPRKPHERNKVKEADDGQKGFV